MEIPDEIPSDELVDAVCDEMAGDMADEMAEFLSLQSNDRLWLRAALPFVQMVASDKFPVDVPGDSKGRLRHATFKMAIAACERAERIFKSDVPRLDLDCDDA